MEESERRFYDNGVELALCEAAPVPKLSVFLSSQLGLKNTCCSSVQPGDSYCYQISDCKTFPKIFWVFSHAHHEEVLWRQHLDVISSKTVRDGVWIISFRLVLNKYSKNYYSFRFFKNNHGPSSWKNLIFVYCLFFPTEFLQYHAPFHPVSKEWR